MRIRRDDGDQRQIVFMTIAELTFIFSFSAFMILSYTNEQDANKIKVSCENSDSFYFDKDSGNQEFETYAEKWQECNPPKKLLQGVNASLVENKALIPCDILDSLYIDKLPNEQYVQIKAKLDAATSFSCSDDTIGTGISQKSLCSAISEILLLQEYLNKESKFTQISNALCPDFELASGVPQAKYSQLKSNLEKIKQDNFNSLQKKLEQIQKNEEAFCQIATKYLEFGDLKSRNINIEDKIFINNFCQNEFTEQTPSTKTSYCGSEDGNPFDSVIANLTYYNNNNGIINFSCKNPNCRTKTKIKSFSTSESGNKINLSKESKKDIQKIIGEFGLTRQKECKYGVRVKSEKYESNFVGLGDFLGLIKNEIGQSFRDMEIDVHIY